MTTEPSNDFETLDRDLSRFASLENATLLVGRPLVGLGIAVVFIIVAGLASTLFFGGTETSYVVIAAAVFGAYMAVNVGANDGANNMGPAVGANALTMGGAIVIAALCESAGAWREAGYHLAIRTARWLRV